MRFAPTLALTAAAILLIAGCNEDDSPTGTTTELPPPDSEPPVVSVGPIIPEQTSYRFEVPVTAQDAESGVAGFELWVVPEYGDTTSVGVFTASPVHFYADTLGRHDFFAVATDSAGNTSQPAAGDSASTVVPERIVITDVLGENFDVTNAVLRYSLHLWGWGHGLGRRAIPPINFPPLIHPGEPGYPEPYRTFSIIGVVFGNSARGYPIDELTSREVANDTVGGVHLAAVY